jgi:predicted transposase/invertase (TIGR01784 family)
MKKSIIHMPHDKLFRSSLQFPEVAREFLELYLPDVIKQQLDFNSISYCQTTFVDEQLKLSQTDVLFKATIAEKDAYIYILAEHEIKVDALIAFWLMKYLIAIWDYHIKQHTAGKALPLPMIVPLVFYTGGQPYTAHRELWQLFGEQSEAMKSILQSPFHLIDAERLPEQELTSHVFAGTMAFIMRNYFRKHLTHEIHKIIDNLNALESCDHHRYLLELIKYMLNVDEEHTNVQELISILQNNMSPAVEKEIMSLAEKLIEQGIEQGIKQGKLEGIREGEVKGKLEGKLEIAERMLTEGSDLVFIEKVTGLSIDQIKTLAKARR